MTEDEARRICAELGATFSIRNRRGKPFVFVCRWIPARAARAAGYKVSTSNGQQFDRYVCALEKLGDLDEQTLRQRIAALPVNPNKLPDGQHLERSTPQLARWHAEAGTPEPASAPD